MSNLDLKALVMGNGPSLDLIDFDALKRSKNIKTFTCNRIAGLCKEKKWLPDYYTAFFAEPFRGTSRYPGTVEQAIGAREDINYIVSGKVTRCYLHTWYKEFVEPSDNVEFHNPVQVNRHKNFDIDTFSKFKTPESFLWYIAVTPLFQLCFQMGIKKIGIIGQDGHKIDSNNNNHYGGYTGPDQHVDKIKLGNSRIVALQNAIKKHANKTGVEIYNLSNDSVINHYPDMSVEEFLK